ncbi:2-oxo acid dehydrogenase subunit E2 [Novosphingobium pentaromativorans]|nr:2-oxo acid dehydrogenase subunit E2 [Novosphingobium pentaromativorans]
MDMQGYFEQFGPVESAATTKFQQVVGKRLSQAWATIPHVTHHDDIDVTALEAHRKALSEAGTRISPLIFLVKALASGLKAFPDFNASLSEDGKTLYRKQYCHVGIAVDGPLGLLVPVLRDADTRAIQDLANELKSVSQTAREKGLPMSAMEGGSMTISSLGGIGGTAFTPIVNPPEVAILGVTKTRIAPVWNGEAFEPRSLMPLSLSYDHRVINGADAARFLRHIADVLAHPQDL